MVEHRGQLRGVQGGVALQVQARAERSARLGGPKAKDGLGLVGVEVQGPVAGHGRKEDGGQRVVGRVTVLAKGQQLARAAALKGRSAKVVKKVRHGRVAGKVQWRQVLVQHLKVAALLLPRALQCRGRGRGPRGRRRRGLGCARIHWHCRGGGWRYRGQGCW